MHNPTRDLEALIAIAKTLLNGWHLYAEVEALLAEAPGATERLGTRGGSRPDPTCASAMRLEHYTETVEGLAGALAQIVWVRDRASLVLRQHYTIAAQVESDLAKIRCSDPVCTANAVAKGLCYRHYRADRRAEGLAS